MPSLESFESALPLVGWAGRGPASSGLQTGEKLEKHSRKIGGRRGRQSVGVRVVGNATLGWLEAAINWGCRLEAVVGKGFNQSVAETFSIPPPLYR